MLRELFQMRWQALAICLVMASGVATAVMSLSTLDSLERTRRAYYLRHRFPHLFVQVQRAPQTLLARIAMIPGVAAAESRVAAAATLDVPGLAEPATARLVSISEKDSPRFNRLYLRRGRGLLAGRRGEAIVAEAFAEAHGLAPGDRLQAIIHGRRKELLIVGVALSPEYIYLVRPGELLPDDKRFAVLWMSREELAAAFDLEGAFNDLCLELSPGASSPEVIRRLDRLLDPYGGTGAYERADQPSYRFLENEMVQLRGMATLPPAIFLSVTAFLLHMVMARLVGSQREQIATLRAFGYRRAEISRHYLGYAAALTALGAGAGLAAGAWFGWRLTKLYARFFRFPEFDYSLDARIALGAVGVSAAAAALGVWSTVARATNEPPARGMQPEPPVLFRKSWVERLLGGKLFAPTTKIAVRRLHRRPLQSVMSCTGIALSIAILVLGESAQDTVDHVMDFQFFSVQRQDVMVTFVEPAPGRARYDLQHLPGVLAVEPFRAASVRLRFGPAVRRLALMGLGDKRRLFRPLDDRRRPVELPAEGVVLSAKLAEVLGCRPGDLVTVEVLEGARAVRQVRVADVVSDYIELNAYMRLDALHRLLREQDAISGAFLCSDSAQAESLYAQLKQTPRLAGVAIRRAGIDSYRKTMAENLLRMKAINVGFAAAVALGVVYNCARISLAEQNRELATLRVLGYSRGETARVLLGELAVLTAAAILPGCVIGYLFAGLLTIALETEIHRFPLIVSPRTYAYSIAVVLVATGLSALFVRRRLWRLDVVSVLKARD